MFIVYNSSPSSEFYYYFDPYQLMLLYSIGLDFKNILCSSIIEIRQLSKYDCISSKIGTINVITTAEICSWNLHRRPAYDRFIQNDKQAIQ